MDIDPSALSIDLMTTAALSASLYLKVKLRTESDFSAASAKAAVATSIIVRATSARFISLPATIRRRS